MLTVKEFRNIICTIQDLERKLPDEELKERIDETAKKLKRMFETNQIQKHTFQWLQARLWAKREELCEALLPANQREKIGSKIF